MAENSKIEWCDHTFNPWVGCSKVSPACDHCYAERWANRVGRSELWTGTRARTSAANWRMPLRWNAQARAAWMAKGTRRPRVFCASLADVFDNQVPIEWQLDLWRLIDATPYLFWLLLTKRIGNARTMLPYVENAQLQRSVWLGATVVTQEEMDRDLPKLLNTPVAVRFLSVEPMLEPIRIPSECAGLKWVICGGESGRGARPLEISWVSQLRRDCERWGIRFFMKQGSQANWPDYKDFANFPESIRVREFPLTQ
jgi:protein gp37